MTESRETLHGRLDIGGTLTDGLFGDGERVEIVKVDTTPHDLTVCFFECLQEGARRFGFDDLTEFLAEVAVVRWSSTIATNAVAERKGPKVGLLISQGHGQDLYGKGRSPAVGFLIQPEHIQPVSFPLDREQVLGAVRHLLEEGVRRICVVWQGPSATRSPSTRSSAGSTSSIRTITSGRSRCSWEATWSTTRTTRRGRISL